MAYPTARPEFRFKTDENLFAGLSLAANFYISVVIV
jgi:hypothetical protein